MKVFYSPCQSVSSNTSFSPSAGKPEAFVHAACERFPGKLEVHADFRGLTAKAISLAHHPDRVAGILACREDNGFGNRNSSVAASLPWTTGSFYAAARAAANGGGATCSPTSGFHHAGYASGGGFCTFNGLVIAAILLRLEGLVKNVAIVDFDMHYGNGTDNILRHEGIDWVVNHSLGAFAASLRLKTHVEDWISGLPRELERVAGGCDLVLYQAGADPHVDDPLGGLLSSDQMRRRDRAVFRWAKGKNMPIAWNLAGGYQKPMQKVLDLHLATVEECLAAFEG